MNANKKPQVNLPFSRAATAIFITGVLSFGLGGCQNGSNTTSETSNDAASSTANPKEQADIKIATESSFRPFSYTDADGNLVGFEIDLANALCEQMHRKCDISSQDWDGLIPGLTAKKFDAIMAGMSITPERSEVVEFSQPYFNNTLVLVGKKNDGLSIDNLNNKSIGSQRATVSASYLAEHYPQTNIKLYDTQDNSYLDLKAGRIDGLLSDKVPVVDWIKNGSGSDYEIKGNEIDINDKIAIALRKNDPLVEQFNQALAELKQNGKYDQIANKYFSTEASTTTPAEAPKASS